jgi:hypothetical protein
VKDTSKSSVNVTRGLGKVLADDLHEFITGAQTPASSSAVLGARMSKGVRYINPKEISPWPELVPEIPPLSETEYGNLKASMKEMGQQYPVLVDERFRILDGNHRHQAAVDLGWDRLMIEERGGLDHNQKRTLALTLNSDRRQLAPEVQASIQMALAELRRERVAEKRQKGQSLNQIADSENVSVAQVRRDLKNAPETTLPGGKVTGKDGRTYNTTKLKGKPKPAEPALYDWEKLLNKESEEHPASLVFLATGRSQATYLVFGDHARTVASWLKLGLTEVRLNDGRFKTALKLHIPSAPWPKWFNHLNRIAQEAGKSILLVGTNDDYPGLKQLADRITGTQPLVPTTNQQQAADLNTLIEHPDPASAAEAARAAIFGETPLSTEGHPIPGLPESEADRAEQERAFRQRLMNNNTRLMQEKEALHQQMEAQAGEIEALKAQLGLPTDPDPLREKLLRSLWYLDQGMAALGPDRSLNQVDSLILKHSDDLAARTTVLHYQAVERLLADDTIDAIRTVAENADKPKQAVEEFLYRLSVEQYQGRAR